MKIIEMNGKRLKIMDEIIDEKYGRIWDAYYEDENVYIVEGKIIKEQAIIDELDNKYGRPVSERNIMI